MTGFKNFAVITPEQNSTGKTSGINFIDFEHTEGNKRGPIYYRLYKSSDAHEVAERYLRAGQYAEAEAAYREALVDYPDHFFLEDALEHLAYRKSLSPEAYTKQLEKVAGRYEDRKFWVEDGRLFYKRDPIVNRVWTTLELLPISAGTYVNLSKKNTRLLFEFEEGEPVASGAEIYDTNISKWVNTAIANPKDRKLRNPDQ
jgi:tetratricopeptide (TPR) repeat protein